MSEENHPPRALSAADHGIMIGSPPPPDKRITHTNWDSPPFNRWSFQRVRDVLPTVPVSRGHGPVSDLQENRQDFDDLSVTLPHAGCKTTVLRALESMYADGFIVVHKGQIIYERYFNGMAPSTLHLSQSVGKSFAGTICGILIGRGTVDPDQPLGDIVPELKDCGYGDATVRHVLDMRSGIQFGENYSDPTSDIALMEPACGWKPARADLPASTLEIIPLLVKEREHGGDFSYRSIETDTMAWVMERTTGKKLAQLTSEELWQPMGAEQDANWTVDRAGYAMASGGLNACLRDYARLGLLYLNDGKASGGRQLIPAEWVHETRQGGDMDAFVSHYKEHFPRAAYKNQFWVRDVEKQQIMARGVFGQLVYVDPSNDLVVACLSTWPDYLNLGYGLDTIELIDALSNALGN